MEKTLLWAIILLLFLMMHQQTLPVRTTCTGHVTSANGEVWLVCGPEKP